MSLTLWRDNHWIIDVERSAEHVADLLALAEREIGDAALSGISADGRFNHAYEAIRALCEAALLASGFATAKGSRQHERAIESLKFTIDGEWTTAVDFLDRCRRIRNQTIDERAGVVQAADADRLLDHARRLATALADWLGREHADRV